MESRQQGDVQAPLPLLRTVHIRLMAGKPTTGYLGREGYFLIAGTLSQQSLTYGRPPSFAPAFIDCKMPEEPVKNDHGELEMSCEYQVPSSLLPLRLISHHSRGLEAPFLLQVSGCRS